MLTLGVGCTRRNAGHYKPYPKQETKGYSLFSTEPLSRKSLESFGNNAPRGMIAQRQNPAYRFPQFFFHKKAVYENDYYILSILAFSYLPSFF